MQAWSQRRHAGPGSATFAVGHGMGNWLIERFTFLGVTFQNWTILRPALNRLSNFVRCNDSGDPWVSGIDSQGFSFDLGPRALHPRAAVFRICFEPNS